MTFALNILNAFLTYPQVPEHLQKEDLLEYIHTRWNPVYVTVGEERHEDGGKHFHVFFKVDKRIRSKDQRYFDWEGCHPNIQSAYNVTKCLEYCQKDGLFIERGDKPDKSIKRSWESCLTAETKEEFMHNIAQQYPRDYVLSLERIEYFADKKFKPQLPAYAPNFTNFIVPAPVAEWMEQMTNVRPMCTLHHYGLPRRRAPAGPPLYGRGSLPAKPWWLAHFFHYELLFISAR